MVCLIDHPSPTSLENFEVRRDPARPEEFREPTYHQLYDATTLFFDSFWVGPSILLQGPPFLNLAPSLQAMKVIAKPSLEECRFHVWEGDRHSRIWVQAPPQTTELTLHTRWGGVDVWIRPNHNDLFKGKRVLFTLSQNNDIHWICDWVRYHRDVHGANGVLFYDNRSTSYAAEDVKEALASLNGIDVVVVVSWDFRYGPQGGPHAYWDSDFCQSGSLEHARWMFLQQARSALNCDIDELIVSPNQQSIFQATEQSWLKTVRFRGSWMPIMETDDETMQGLVQHRDFTIRKVPQRYRKWLVLPKYEHQCAPKWCVVPQACPRSSQWNAHRIKGWLQGLLTSSAFSFRHYFGINTRWKRAHIPTEEFDPSLHEEDLVLLAHYSKVNWDD